MFPDILKRALPAAVLLCLATVRPARSEPVNYYDTRDFNVNTITSQLKIAPRLEYFSFD